MSKYTALLMFSLLLASCSNNTGRNNRMGNGANSLPASVGTVLMADEEDSAEATVNINKKAAKDDALDKMYAGSEPAKKELAKRRSSVTATLNGFYPEGSERKLTGEDIKFLSAWGHDVMLNEIYARHGMIFKDAALKAHFMRQQWYKGTSQNVYQKLTDIEKQNVTFLINTAPGSK